MFTIGLTGENTEVNGKIIKWKVVEYFSGQMVEDTKVNTLTIRRKATGYFTGN